MDLMGNGHSQLMGIINMLQQLIQISTKKTQALVWQIVQLELMQIMDQRVVMIVIAIVISVQVVVQHNVLNAVEADHYIQTNA